MDFLAFLQQNTPAFAACVFVLSLLIGSFLNVVIYRLPLILEREWQAQCAEMAGQPAPSATGTETLTLATPRSFCPACKAPVRAIHNVPVVSWLALRGRCANCGARIPARYPLVELATAVLSAAVAWHFGFGFEAACALAVTWMLIPLTGIDLDHQLLPDVITLPLLWLGLLASLWHDPASGAALPASPTDAIVGAAAGYLFLLGVFHVFKLLTGKEGMGYGDFKLFGALGAWLGWQMLPLILLLSAGVGAVVGIGLMVVRKQGRDVPIPYGPYLAGAGWIALMWGPQIVGGYLSMAGLR
ncbi:MAG: leader peptidase PliD [Proteobacteria bacterium]|nr:leader peptidase PliD [Pseudomonadota bacterium]